MAYLPDRGHVVWITLSPTLGHEQSGRRPVLVLSPAFYNKRSGMLLACPITSRIKGYPFEVQLPPGLPVAGTILADQIRSLDWAARPVQKIAVLPEDVVEHTLAYGRTLLS